MPAPNDFLSTIDRSAGPDGCWPWTGAIGSRGYGNVRFRGRQCGTHRVAFELATGVNPAGMFVLHRCDNARCCNPAHLFLGTHADNMADRTHKRRQSRGSRHGNAKLNEVSAILIRQLHRRGATGLALANSFGIDDAIVSEIVHGRRWTSALEDINGRF